MATCQGKIYERKPPSARHEAIQLLGVIITNDLKWHENTKFIVKNANRKMGMLHKFSKFTKNKLHLMHLFKHRLGDA